MIPLTTNADQKARVYQIASKMAETGLSKDFIADAAKMALEYEGVHDLMVLGEIEIEQSERNEIIADIQDMVDEHQGEPKKPRCSQAPRG